MKPTAYLSKASLEWLGVKHHGMSAAAYGIPFSDHNIPLYTEAPALPRAEVQRLASEVIRAHGTAICAALNRDNERQDGHGMSGGNIMALMEIFYERLMERGQSTE